MYSVNVRGYKTILQQCYEKKVPLYVYGGPGIGKSEVPRQVFSKIADSMGRKFIEWSNLTLDEKKELILHPETAFIFCDQRVGQMDTTDLRGIPNMVDVGMLETIPMTWAVALTQKNAAGAIFFDELNLAAPVVAGQAYQIINDRVIADRRLADDVYVFGAGNRTTDKAHVFQMPFPLRDRFCEMGLSPDVDCWTEWAASAGVHSHLISFINWKATYLYKPDEKSDQKGSTPRGIVRASKLIKGLNFDDPRQIDIIHQMVSISVGEAFATEFQAYVTCYSELNWDEIFKNPKTVSNFSIDKLWAIAGGLGDFYSKGIKEQGEFDRLIDVVKHMPTDYAIVSLRMIRDASSLNTFVKHLKKYPDREKVLTKYSPYLQQ